MSLSSAADRAQTRGKTAADRAAESSVADRLGQLGVLSRGIVAVVVAILAVQVAEGGGSYAADSQGALQAIAAQPLGLVVLCVLAAAFAGHAAWRLLEAAGGLRQDSGERRTLKRVWFAVLGAVYAGLCVTTVRVITGRHVTDENARSHQAANDLLGFPGGRVLTFVVGVAVVGAGVGIAVWACRGSFLRRLHVERLGRKGREAVRWLGAAGQSARAAIVAMAGLLLVDAAVENDASRAQGLDGTLRTVAGRPYGHALLLACAAGLAVFAVYSGVEAALLRTTHDEAGEGGRPA